MTRVDVVEVAGEFSIRGGLLDVFPIDALEPVRIEFFGDDVESIRPFSPECPTALTWSADKEAILPVHRVVDSMIKLISGT